MGPTSGLPVTGFPKFWTGDGRKKHQWLETRRTVPEQTDQARPIVTVLQCNPTELKTVLCHYMLVGSNLHGRNGHIEMLLVHSLLVFLEQGEHSGL